MNLPISGLPYSNIVVIKQHAGQTLQTKSLYRFAYAFLHRYSDIKEFLIDCRFITMHELNIIMPFGIII